MSAFSKIKVFFSRHRSKFIVGGFLITGSFLLTKYVQKQLREWQEKETMEFIEKNRKKNHFENINRTCNQTVLNLSSALLDKVYQTINTDEIIENLKKNPENKLEMWNKLKSQVFVKAACVVYSLVMLVVTLKLQLNIVGGYLYKDPKCVPAQIQEKYLSLCQSFLNSGIEKLALSLEIEVTKLLERVSLTKQMKVSDLEAIFWSLQSSLDSRENNPINQFRQYIFADDLFFDDTYSGMLKDTADLLESEEVKSLVVHYINTGFMLLGDQLSEFFTQNGVKITEISTNASGDPDKFQNSFMNKKPLAKIIPILNGLLSKQSMPQNLIQLLISNDKLQTLCANVYESLLV